MNELPWVTARVHSNPERVVELSRCPLSRRAGGTLSGLDPPPHRRPRVARPSQPWALMRNPFGILPPIAVLMIRISPLLPADWAAKVARRAQLRQRFARPAASVV